MIRAMLFTSVMAACAPRAMNVSTEHPANPDAAPGRTAGPPAALRPGVATLDEPAPSPAMDHSQHTSPKPDPAKPDKTDPAADRAKVDTVEDMPGEPRRVDPEKVNPQKVEPSKEKKPAPKPAPKKPAAKPPAKQPKPAEPAKEPMPPMDHSGHGGQP